MMDTTITKVIISTLIIFLTILNVSAQSVKSDDFSKNDLANNWIIVNPNPDSRIQIIDGQLKMRASIANGGSDLWNASNYNAPRIVQEVKSCSRFIVETKLKVNLTTNYQGAGILIVRGDTPDSENALRICHYLIRSPEYYTFISLGRLDFENSNSPSYNDLIRYNNSEIYFRLETDSRSLYRWYSADNINWIFMDSLYSDTPIKYIGLFAASQKWSTELASDLEASFEYWKVSVDTFRTDLKFNICQGDSVKVGNKFYTSTGTYIDTLASSTGCDSIIRTNLTIFAPEIIEQSFDICSGDSVIVGTDIYRTPGNYTYTILSQKGCDSIVFHTTINAVQPLNLELGNDTILCHDEMLNIGTTIQAANYLWNNGATEPFIDAQAPGAYSLTVSNNCYSVSDTINIEAIDCDCKVFIPNAFSPNEDGKNDMLIIKEENIISSRIIIYNKWGEEVFATDNNQNNWNGAYKNKQLPPDVYGYYYSGTCLKGDLIELKGNITIIR